jgi:copper ion binding protein
MKTKLSIEGMHCEHCVKSVEEALKAVQGVKKAKVNLKKASGEVDHAETVTLDALKAAVAEAGFTAA